MARAQVLYLASAPNITIYNAGINSVWRELAKLEVLNPADGVPYEVSIVYFPRR